MFKAKLARMDPIYRDAITALQPYKHPRAEGSRRLVRLSALDNLDKHNLLLPIAATGGPDPEGFIGVTFDGHRPLVIYNPGQPLAPGVELLRQRLPRNRRKGQVIYGETLVMISLRIGANDISLVELADIRSHVVGIVESFGPSFDG